MKINNLNDEYSFPVFDGRREDANYIEHKNPSYKGNPLIEALPPIIEAKKEFFSQFSYYPEYYPEMRFWSVEDRIHGLRDILELVQPMNQHWKMWGKVTRALYGSYVGRNPIVEKEIYKQKVTQDPKKHRKLRRARALKRGLALIGLTGIGKTTLAQEILQLITQVIYHGQYKGEDFMLSQLVWLFLNCPHDASRGAFCDSLFGTVDDSIGSNYQTAYGGLGIVEKMNRVKLLCRRLKIGMLVVDDAQRFSLMKGGGSLKLLEFLVQLSNEIQMPIFFSGTNQALNLLTSALQLSRRVSGQGDSIWRPMQKDDDDWLNLMDALEKYQYLRNPFQLKGELSDTLYFETQGITDFVINLFIYSLERAMVVAKTPEDEILDYSVIKSAAADEFSLFYPALEALRNGDTSKYEDLMQAIRDPYTKQPQANLSSSHSNSESKVNNGSNQPTRSDNNTTAPISETNDHMPQSDNQSPSPQAAKPPRKRASKPKPATDDSRIIRPENDLREIIERGQKHKLAPYVALKEAGYIRDLSDFLQPAGG